MECTLADKTAEMDSLKALIKQLEGIQKSFIQEIETEKAKARRSDEELLHLRKAHKEVTDELQQCRIQLEKKTATNKAVLDDLLENYREVEKEKLEATRQLEEKISDFEVLR